MSNTTRTTTVSAVRNLRESFAPAARAERKARAAERAALEHDLAAFESQADLADLAATLERHSDGETAEVRNLVDWTRAA